MLPRVGYTESQEKYTNIIINVNSITLQYPFTCKLLTENNAK